MMIPRIVTDKFFKKISPSFFSHILQHYMQTKSWVKVAMASKPPEAVDEGRKRGCLFVVCLFVCLFVFVCLVGWLFVCLLLLLLLL